MRRIEGVLLLGVSLAPAILAAPAVGWAQAERPVCTGAPAPMPPAYAAWAAKSDLNAAGAAADLPKAELVPGKAITAHLLPTKQVAYVVQPEKPGGSVSKGGMFEVKIDTAGVYRFASGSGAWVDVLKDGKILESVNHMGGPACTGIRKMVDFPLEPGRYVLQISANADDVLPFLVLPQP
jgi:hypothetical protein